MSDVQTLRAMAHPLRLRLLSLLAGSAMSAAEAGRELRVTQPLASYHLRVLERAELIEVVETERVRGGDARRYRYQIPSQPFVAEVSRPSEDRQVLIEAMIDELRRRSHQRAEGPTVTTDAEVWVDDDTWHRVVQHVGEAAVLLHAAARPPRTPRTRPVAMTAALFPLRRP